MKTTSEDRNTTQEGRNIAQEDLDKIKEDLSKIKVLYIEDDLEFAKMIKSLLEKDGFKVETAPSTTKFKSLFHSFRPDIAMVDLDLKEEMQGIDIIRYVHNEIPLFPIIVYSAHVESSTVIETMECGVMHHIGKDKSIPELMVMLKNAIKQAYRYGENFQPVYQLSEITSYNIKTYILSIDGKEIQLKRIESNMLRQLCLHINEYISPEELFIATWGIIKSDRQLHRYISALRKIIEPLDPSIQIINKRGTFYQLECKEWK